MATITVDRDHIDIQLSALEKLGGLLRDQRIPRTAVTGVTAVTDAVRAPSGIRAPGFALPGRAKVGTWRAKGSRQLVCVRAGQPAVQIDVAGQPFDRYLVGADDASEIAAEIRDGF